MPVSSTATVTGWLMLRASTGASFGWTPAGATASEAQALPTSPTWTTAPVSATMLSAKTTWEPVLVKLLVVKSPVNVPVVAAIV
jgi:hypothetical protein